MFSIAGAAHTGTERSRTREVLLGPVTVDKAQENERASQESLALQEAVRDIYHTLSSKHLPGITVCETSSAVTFIISYFLSRFSFEASNGGGTYQTLTSTAASSSRLRRWMLPYLLKNSIMKNAAVNRVTGIRNVYYWHVLAQNK